MPNTDTTEQPPFLDEKAAVERIQAVVANARTIWFALIGFLAFAGATLLSVRDLDFFSLTATTQLPIVNIAIPTATFFWTASWLAALLHAYLHLYLLKLWDALAEAPPKVGGRPLGDRLFPWLVVDWALRQRPDKPTTPRPMDRLADGVSLLLVWAATPLMLVAFWWRSMPAHDAFLTLTIAAALALSLYASRSGWRLAADRLSSPGLQGTGRSKGSASPWPKPRRELVVLVAVALIAASLARTEFESVVRVGPYAWSSLAPIDLVNAEIAQRPSDWQDHDVAQQRFRTVWCRDRGLPPLACDEPHHPDQTLARERWCTSNGVNEEDCAARFRSLDTAFARDWHIERRAYLTNLSGPDLRGRDLRGALARGAFLAGIDLRDARLEGADVYGARLQGADLRGAQLEGLNMDSAWLERANLSDAELAGANLRWARLEGANLTWARLEGADLGRAKLEGASLNFARLEGADLSWAHLEGADLSEAQLEGAKLNYAELAGVNLSLAGLEGADLRWARLEGANLSRAQLDGVDLSGARLPAAEWTGTSIGASPAHSADLTAGRNLTRTQLSLVIGNADTILPRDAKTGEHLDVWTCWAEPPLTLDALLHRWPESLQDDARAEWLCPPGVAPEPTGRPAAD